MDFKLTENEFYQSPSTLGWVKYDKSSEAGKPKASGTYFVWTSGIATTCDWSAKHQGWNICDDGDRAFEYKDIEFWAAIVPPIF